MSESKEEQWNLYTQLEEAIKKLLGFCWSF